MDVTNAISVARVTDIGQLRVRNEDAVASELTTGLIMVADGMGGHKGGETASEIAVLVVAAELAELMRKQGALNKKSSALTVADMLDKVVSQANNAIYAASQRNADCEGMGATLVTGVFINNKIVVGHIGDSRMYRLRENRLEPLTEDHSLLQEQINAGLITKEQAKVSNNSHLITRALGTDAQVALEINEYVVKVDDIYLLCSDGLTDLVSDEEISEILVESRGNVNVAAKNLVTLANNHGGNDNISVLTAFVKEAFSVKGS
ncbi:MAG: Stp1/IreP family PP2C-type Ser/Thr phosphatase [Methylophilaceae bacterium]